MPQGSVLGPLLFLLHLLPLGSILLKHGILFHFYADDCQIHVPLARNDSYSFQPLLECLNNVKAWIALNVLSFDDKKTEVMMFGPSSTSVTPNVDLGSLAPYVTVTNRGVRFDSDFKFDKQISSVLKSSFYQLRQIAKVKIHCVKAGP